MPYYEKKCGNCGATVVKGDVICRTCGKLIQNDCRYIEREEDTINGVPVSDISLFIDKNSSRYVDIFSKNEGKKIFFNMNWSAMFFNVYWMFYRKMYKYAIIFLIVNLLFTFGLTAAVSACFKSQIAEADKMLAPYSEFVEESNGLYIGGFDEAVDFDEFMSVKREYDKEINSIIAKMSFWLIVPSLAFSTLFGLLADCIYRRYVIKNCGYSDGGTSVGSMILGIAVYQVVTNIIISPIITEVAVKILR